jgi:hypothetical protein
VAWYWFNRVGPKEYNGACWSVRLRAHISGGVSLHDRELLYAEGRTPGDDSVAIHRDVGELFRGDDSALRSVRLTLAWYPIAGG